MLKVLTETIRSTFSISVFVFVMMLLVDYVNVLTKGSFSAVVKKGRFRQYVLASFLGVMPGCLGGFMNVSFYAHGVISFGAMFASMVSDCGDEEFVMLASFPGRALLLFGILFLMGVVFGWLADAIAPLMGPRYGKGCKLGVVHDEDECYCFDRAQIWRQLKRVSTERALLVIAFGGAIFAGAGGLLEGGWEKITIIILAAGGVAIVGTAPDHYLKTHIVAHIVRRHLVRIMLWTFLTLLVIGIGLKYWDFESFVRKHEVLVFLLAGLIGLIPESGPHLIFVNMFAKGVIPFSVLLTNSIIQDGHTLLPLLSCSVRDALTVKGMKLIIGLAAGIAVHALGW